MTVSDASLDVGAHVDLSVASAALNALVDHVYRLAVCVA